MGTLFVAPAASYHHHHHPHHHAAAGGHDQILSYPSSEHPMIPLLAAADIAAKPAGTTTGIHLWQPQPQLPSPIISSSAAAANTGTTIPYLGKQLQMLDAAAGILTGASGCSSSTCQDCGNQAKKDCSQRRCRTCCKSRGFECSTHIKSTWVPSARRRERRVAAVTGVGGADSSTSTSAMKNPRLISSQTAYATTSHTSTSNTTPPRSSDTSSSRQDQRSLRENLPGQVREATVFKCVRVTSIDEGQDQYAYEAMVKIGGHVFKGFLYDQGLGDRPGDADGNNGTKSTIPNISELQLAGGGDEDVFGGGGGGGTGRGLVGGGATNIGNALN